MSFFSERQKAWEDLNLYLVKDDWMGITEAATRRSPPFDMGLEINLKESADFTKLSYSDHEKLDVLLANPRGPFIIGRWTTTSVEQFYNRIEENYRYQRPV